MKTSKRILILLLCTLMLIGCVAVPAIAWKEPSPRYFARVDNDVPKDFWAYDDIAWVANNQIMGGTGVRGCFEPNIPTTRSMFAKICVNFISALENPTTVESAAPFTDVKAGEWYADAVNFCYENSILKGKGDGTFGINENITREQLCQLFCALIENYFGMELPVTEGILDRFKDADTISGWARTAVAKIASAGLVSGKPGGIFAPQGEATRAEAASLIERVYRFYSVNWQCYLDLELIPSMLEDFDGEGLHGWNDNVWTATYNDVEWYLPEDEMMYTEDGVLHMNVMDPGDHDTASNNGITGLITGCDEPNKFYQTYGFYEIRFVPNPARGICSAWWLTTNALPYPEEDSPEDFIEMDIFETTPMELNLHSTMHNHRKLGDTDIGEQERLYCKVNKFNRERKENDPYCIPDSSMFDGAYHTVGFLWTKEGFTLYFDGNYVGQFGDIFVSNMPAVLWLNTYYWNAYEWAGPCYSEDFDENGLSAFLIDYVHVYQLAEYANDNPPVYVNTDLPDYFTDGLAAYNAANGN